MKNLKQLLVPNLEEKQKYMAQAGLIAAKVHAKMTDLIKAGVNTLELESIALEVIESNGAQAAFKGIYDYQYATCISVNEEVVHGTPRDYVLQDGDIVSIDVGAKVNGWNSDTAKTYAVGPISHDKKKLMEVTEQALYNGLSVVKDGVKVGDISYEICSYVYKNNMSIPEEFSGHGIGRSLHEEPYIYNIGQKGQGPTLKAGDTIAIEPIVIFGNKEIKIAEDKWTAISVDKTPAAHYEHTVEITKKGYKILTSLDQKEVING